MATSIQQHIHAAAQRGQIDIVGAQARRLRVEQRGLIRLRRRKKARAQIGVGGRFQRKCLACGQERQRAVESAMAASSSRRRAQCIAT